MENPRTSKEWSDHHLLGQLSADGHPRATNRANHVSPARQFAKFQFFAKPQISQPITTGPADHSDPHIAAHPNLIEGHDVIDFQIGYIGLMHATPTSGNEIGLQQ